MITIQLDTIDLESFRFSYSPMIELVSSFKALNNPEHYGLFGAWLDEAQQALNGIEFPYLQAVALQKYYIADFVTQTPIKPRMTLDEEFALVRNTPPDLIRKHVNTVIETSEESEIRRHYLMYPQDAVDCLLAEMELYWDRVLA